MCRHQQPVLQVVNRLSAEGGSRDISDLSGSLILEPDSLEYYILAGSSQFLSRKTCHMTASLSDTCHPAKCYHGVDITHGWMELNQGTEVRRTARRHDFKPQNCHQPGVRAEAVYLCGHSFPHLGTGRSISARGSPPQPKVRQFAHI